MSRWIDAEYCEDFFDRWESRVKKAEPVTIDVVQNTRTLLRDAPSIDIVRCKECKHCSLDVCVERTVSGKERCINICNRHSTEWVVDEDWFCADAERKEGE